MKLHEQIVQSHRDVLHTCDNPRCVNPKHLVLGNPKLNAKHRAERDRFVASCGNTKIKSGSEEENILLNETIPVTVVAKQLGVHRKTIWQRRKEHRLRQETQIESLDER